MPTIPKITQGRKSDSFALMIRNGESLAPAHVLEIGNRSGLFPRFITFSQGSPLDVSRLYARALGAKLFLPRSASAALQILSTCNFSICESAESAILSLSACIPAYISVSSPECRNFAARLCSRGISPHVLIPYAKNRTDRILRVSPREEDFAVAISEVRNILNML